MASAKNQGTRVVTLFRFHVWKC